jgi:hypothetical protein
MVLVLLLLLLEWKITCSLMLVEQAGVARVPQGISPTRRQTLNLLAPAALECLLLLTF